MQLQKYRGIGGKKYFGIHIDTRFLWAAHIMEIGKKKSDYFVGWFYYLQALVPTNICSTIYYSLVESILSYGIILNMGCGA